MREIGRGRRVKLTAYGREVRWQVSEREDGSCEDAWKKKSEGEDG